MCLDFTYLLCFEKWDLHLANFFLSMRYISPTWMCNLEHTQFFLCQIMKSNFIWTVKFTCCKLCSFNNVHFTDSDVQAGTCMVFFFQRTKCNSEDRKLLWSDCTKNGAKTFQEIFPDVWWHTRQHYFLFIIKGTLY